MIFDPLQALVSNVEQIVFFSLTHDWHNYYQHETIYLCGNEWIFQFKTILKLTEQLFIMILEIMLKMFCNNSVLFN